MRFVNLASYLTDPESKKVAVLITLLTEGNTVF